MVFTEKDLEEGKKLIELFQGFSVENKIMVIAYMSALRDKQLLSEQRENGKG